MTHDEIISIYREVSNKICNGTEWCWSGAGEPLKLFANLVAAKEREALAQRTWQGLTDEEIAQGCKESWVTEQAWQSAVWWAEAKLKEKNT